MVDQVLEKLIEFLENASPLVWEALLKQVYNNAISNFVWAGLLLVICITLIIVTAWIIKQTSKDDNEDGTWFSIMFFVVIFTLVAVGVMIGTTLSGWKMLNNPTYYAIMDVIHTIGGN